jgi:preprotein translocase subunit SecD
MAGVSMSQAKEIIGKQGKFEISLHTTGNETVHVLYGESIQSVANPAQSPPNSNNWGVSFIITPEAAETLRQIALSTGALTNPVKHNLDMILDKKVVFSAPLSSELASDLQAKASSNLLASTGYGVQGKEQARLLEIHLRNGALPVEVEVSGSGSVSTEPGEH